MKTLMNLLNQGSTGHKDSDLIFSAMRFGRFVLVHNRSGQNFGPFGDFGNHVFPFNGHHVDTVTPFISLNSSTCSQANLMPSSATLPFSAP